MLDWPYCWRVSQYTIWECTGKTSQSVVIEPWVRRHDAFTSEVSDTLISVTAGSLFLSFIFQQNWLIFAKRSAQWFPQLQTRVWTMMQRTMKKTKKRLIKPGPPNTGVATNTMLALTFPCFLVTGTGTGFVSHKSRALSNKTNIFWLRKLWENILIRCDFVFVVIVLLLKW